MRDGVIDKAHGGRGCETIWRIPIYGAAGQMSTLGYAAVLTVACVGSLTPMANAQQDAMVVAAEHFVDALANEDYAGAVALFNAELASVMDAGRLRDAWRASTKSLGSLEKPAEMRIGGPGQRRTVVAVCRFEKGVYYLQISFDTDNAISTFYLHSRSPVAAPTSKPEPSGPSAGREIEMELGAWACFAAAVVLPLCVFLALSRRGQGTIVADGGGKTPAERVGTPTLIVLALYGASVLTGAITYQIGGQDVAASVQESGDKLASMESQFGAYRAPLRDGVLSAILTVAAIVFAMNLCGNLLNFTVLGALILPLGFLLFAGWSQGVSIASLTASSAGSLLGFLAVGGLESGTYVLAAAAGLNAGLSFLMPARQGARSRLARRVAVLRGHRRHPRRRSAA